METNERRRRRRASITTLPYNANVGARAHTHSDWRSLDRTINQRARTSREGKNRSQHLRMINGNPNCQSIAMKKSNETEKERTSSSSSNLSRRRRRIMLIRSWSTCVIRSSSNMCNESQFRLARGEEKKNYLHREGGGEKQRGTRTDHRMFSPGWLIVKSISMSIDLICDYLGLLHRAIAWRASLSNKTIP